MTLRKRIARFLFGVNGTDITLSQAEAVSIAVQASPVEYVVTISSSLNPTASYFKEAFRSGILSWPFQLVTTIDIV